MSALTSDVRVYRISLRRYLVMWWFLGPLFLFGLGLVFFGEPDSRESGILIIAILTPFAVLWHFLARWVRLEISPRGVLTRELGGGFDVPWTDISSIRGDPGHEGFITARPMDNKGARNLAANASPKAMYDRLDLQLIAARRFIPMRAFARHLHHGELRSVIAAHAPHLEEALKALDIPPTSTLQQNPPEERGVWLLLAMVTAMFTIALAWGLALIW